jgi:hypothetical protein
MCIDDVCAAQVQGWKLCITAWFHGHSFRSTWDHLVTLSHELVSGLPQICIIYVIQYGIILCGCGEFPCGSGHVPLYLWLYLSCFFGRIKIHYYQDNLCTWSLIHWSNQRDQVRKNSFFLYCSPKHSGYAVTGFRDFYTLFREAGNSKDRQLLLRSINR